MATIVGASTAKYGFQCKSINTRKRSPQSVNKHQHVSQSQSEYKVVPVQACKEINVSYGGTTTESTSGVRVHLHSATLSLMTIQHAS